MDKVPLKPQIRFVDDPFSTKDYWNVDLIFIGPVGSGKTTIIRAIYNWYERVGVVVKTKNKKPNFDVKHPDLKLECERCLEESTERVFNRIGSTTTDSSEDAIFQKLGGVFKMEIPKIWFASYLWCTEAEKSEHMTESFSRGKLNIRLCEQSDVNITTDGGWHGDVRVYVHVVSLRSSEINNSFRFLHGALTAIPSDDGYLRTHRCILYTKSDTYTPQENPDIHSNVGFIDHIKRDAVILDFKKMHDLYLTTVFSKTVACVNNVISYDKEFGVLRFFFDLLGKVIVSNCPRKRVVDDIKPFDTGLETPHQTLSEASDVFLEDLEEKCCCQ